MRGINFNDEASASSLAAGGTREKEGDLCLTLSVVLR